MLTISLQSAVTYFVIECWAFSWFLLLFDHGRNFWGLGQGLQPPHYEVSVASVFQPPRIWRNSYSCWVWNCVPESEWESL